MARTKKIEPILLYQDTNWVGTKIIKQNEKNIALEKAIWELKKLFANKISDIEAINLIKSGWTEIENEIRKISGYTNGDLATILKLWGTHQFYETSKAAITGEVKTFVTYNSSEFELKNGKVTTTKQTIRELNEIAKKYATTEDQIERYNDLSILASALNHVFDKGIIHTDSSYLSGQTKQDRIKPFKGHLSIDENDRVVPNWYHIYSMKN